MDCPGFIFVAVNLPKETFEACCYRVTRSAYVKSPDQPGCGASQSGFHDVKRREGVT